MAMLACRLWEHPIPLYLQAVPHLLGGNGDQPLHTVLLQLALLLNDVLKDVVNVDFAQCGNL